MPIPLSVLVVEDMESDAQLLVRLLKRAGYNLTYERVQTAVQMRDALKKQPWDIVISDYNMPQFDGYAALSLLKEIGLDIPFIVVSGEIGEETAVSMMKAGAQDYLIKNNLTRLVPAVERELEQAGLRRMRKQAEAELRESEDRYRILVESSPDSICIHCEGEVVYANPATAKLLHAKCANDLIGMKAIDFVHPDYRTIALERMRRSYENREPASLLEEKFITLEGDTIDVEVMTTPIVHFGKPSTQLIIRDITERKQIQKALIESEAKFRWLYEYAPMAYHLLTSDGIITDVNHRWCKLLGYDREEVVGRSIFDFVVAEEGEEAKKSFEAKKQRRQSFVEGGQRNFLTKDGAVKIFKTYDFFVLDQEKNITSVQTTIEDITERVRAEEAVQTTNILLEQTLEQSPIPMVLVSMPDYIIRNANSACREFLGIMDEPSPAGTPLFDIRPSWQDFDMQGNAAKMEDLPLALSLKGLKTGPQERHIVRKDGTSVYELVYGSPIFDAADRLIAGFLVMVDITERKKAEESIQQHIRELETLYQCGLVMSQFLNPKEIGQKLLEILEEKLNWRHTRIRLYHPRKDVLELLDFNGPGYTDGMTRDDLTNHFQGLITRSGEGMSGWVVQHGIPIRSGDVRNDSRYVEAYPEIRSGIYAPMKLGERVVGVISIESEQADAFSAADERLIVTLANQAASAFENARLFEGERQRVAELETINRISSAMRTASKQSEMLSSVLDEALSILNTSHGAIELYNNTTQKFEKTVTRGWVTQVKEPPQSVDEGIVGWVFTNGQNYITRELLTDPMTRDISRNQVPSGWGGIFLPIWSDQKTLGVLSIAVPSEHELSADEIRLLSTLSEMTGTTLQRMQLHEQTVRHLEQLNALRTVDQAIASSRDMRLTLNIILTHTVSQLGVDAVDVLLFSDNSNMLRLAASHGFYTSLVDGVDINSFAGRAVLEHRLINVPDIEVASQNVRFGRLWKEEGFVCYWCVPLIVKGEVKGVLEVYRRSVFVPDMEWLDFLETLAGQAAIAVDSANLFEYLQRANLDLRLAYDATIEGWSRAMDLRDRETEGHTLRVTELTVRLARLMNVSESQLTAVRRGALLHDIGKMGVPDSILLKDGKLTKKEWAVMRKHPQFAYDMLSPIGYLNEALDIPYYHHEKWDGTGYPHGLKGVNIPLVARIFAVVDVWDALTNNRTYRKKWTKKKAREYIKEQSGKHFDPQVADVFLKNIK